MVMKKLPDKSHNLSYDLMEKFTMLEQKQRIRKNVKKKRDGYDSGSLPGCN